MELKLNFDALFKLVDKYGIKGDYININLKSNALKNFDTKIETTSGKEINIEEVSVDENTRLLTYDGKHIILFIPDHSFSAKSFSEVRSNPKNGNRFHVTDCKTLEKMRQIKRYNRYAITKNTSGYFEITAAEGQRGEVELYVCKNCLNQLNYNNYRSAIDKDEAVRDFNLKEFFKYYEPHFKQLPDDIGQTKSGYAADWESISKTYREKKHYRCEECAISLIEHKELSHVHHINGVKHDNSEKNLKVLCKECHSKQPNHTHLKLTYNEKLLLNQLRHEQGLFGQHNLF